MKDILNLQLLTSPVNWVIVLMILLIGSFALHVVLPVLVPTSSTQ